MEIVLTIIVVVAVVALAAWLLPKISDMLGTLGF